MSFDISAKGLGKKYTKEWAVKDISFEIHEGEIFGFLGPNGAGKTTTLRMLCGVLDPTEGSCTVNGLDTVADKIAVKSIVGYLPEEDFLYGDMTVKDHLEYMASLYGVKDVKDAVSRTLDLVDLDGKIGEKVKTLSKGQRRRVAIAKTLIHDPKLVLLDEVTSGLDPLYAKKMVDMVKKLRKDGKTVIFSTHQLDEATKLCDKMLIIQKGKMKACGTEKDILKKTDSNDLEEAFFKLME
ncbi:MAG: ABC transporter ATP-binding protein [Candidatus Altiarchaeota archaeon]|nr:ABC transporter ATP-binding protein [Candidatus Altiarchaeota archaeon]